MPVLLLVVFVIVVVVVLGVKLAFNEVSEDETNALLKVLATRLE